MNYQDIKDYAEKYAVPIMRTETSKLIADFVKEITILGRIAENTPFGLGIMPLFRANMVQITKDKIPLPYIDMTEGDFYRPVRAAF